MIARVYLSWLQNKVRILELRKKFIDPLSEGLIIINNLDHQIHLLKTRRQEIIATWFIFQRTVSTTEVSQFNLVTIVSYLS